MTEIEDVVTMVGSTWQQSPLSNQIRMIELEEDEKPHWAISKVKTDWPHTQSTHRLAVECVGSV